MDAASGRLERAGVARARREAGRLLAFVLHTDRGGVAARRPDPIPEDASVRFEALLARRERREPFQYLVGSEEFFGREFRVDRRVLVPRPETEQVVEAMLEPGLGDDARILDVGTGSGCIAVTLACERPGWRVRAVDASVAALAVARANADRLGVTSRLEILEANLEALVDGPYDGLVSNPPYVSEAEWATLEPEVRDHEPREALVPGTTGVEAYRALAPEAARVLTPGGRLVVELGFGRERGAVAAVEGAGFTNVEIRPDMRGIPRVLVATRARGVSSGR